MTQILKLYDYTCTFPLNWHANSETLYGLLHTIEMCGDDEDILTHLIKTNQHKNKEIYFIFADENALIGAIVVKNDPARRECTVQDVAVIPSHRRQGHAEKALRGLINSRYPAWSFKLRVGYSTAEGEALFNKLGFHIHKVEWTMTSTKQDVVLH